MEFREPFDFKFVIVADVSGFCVDGSGPVVDLLPVRAGVEVPLSGGGDEGHETEPALASDLRAYDIVWLLEACGERNALVPETGSTTQSKPRASLRVLLTYPVEIAGILYAWARRWETASGQGVWFKAEILEALSGGWHSIGGGTIDWKAHTSVSSYDDALEANELLPRWRDFVEQSGVDPKEFDWPGKIRAFFSPYALRAYDSLADLFGAVPDDSEDGFSWAEVDGWDDGKPYVVSGRTVLKLFSDMEKTVVGAREPSLDTSVNVNMRDKIVDDVVNKWSTYADVNVVFFVSWMAFIEVYGTNSEAVEERSVIDNGSDTKTSESWYPSVNALFSSLSNALDVTTCSYAGGLFPVGFSKVSHKMRYFRMEDGDPERWVRDYSRTYERKVTRTATSSVTWSLPSTVPAEVEIVSAHLVMFAVSVEERATLNYENYNVDSVREWEGDCKFGVFMKFAPCEVSPGGRRITLPFSGMNMLDLPSPSGGPAVTLDFSVLETYMADGGSFPRERLITQETDEATGERRSLCALGPLIIKFKPRTLVEDRQ